MQQLLQQMIDAAAKGALLLTANKRLARLLRDQFDTVQQRSAQMVWRSPLIFSFEGWLQHALAELEQDWRLLSPAQVQCLWEQLIEQSLTTRNRSLLNTAETAEKAVAAHQLLTAYRVEIDGFALTEDQAAFHNWRQTYLLQCREHQWLDSAHLPGYLCSALKAGMLQRPESVWLIGFDQLPPGAELLRETLTACGGACRVLQFEAPKKRQAFQLAALDSRDEILAAARWARGLLEAGVRSIGVVVPDLNRRRADLERIFCQQIDPAAAPALHDDEALFSLSLGSPLSEQGVVAAGLDWLSLGRRLSLDQISGLLLSPYLAGGVSESEARAAADRTLRTLGQQHLTLSGLCRWCSAQLPATRLLSQLNDLQESLNKATRLPPSGWGEHFAGLLQRLGWPGERSLSSREYQAVRAWQDKVFAELSRLDRVLPSLTRNAALQLMRRLTRDVEFQPEGPTGPVQVLGLLESSGIEFEHLWVMGLGDHVLPAHPRPNPFLPGELQRQCGMPHASAARELEFAEQVINRLLVSSPRVVLSYPQWDGSTPLRPSPLLGACETLGEPILAERRDPLWLQTTAPGDLEIRRDRRGPLLSRDYAAGGVGLLKEQAECPFRAFVHYRLHARALEVPDPGIAPPVRGELVHQVLERVWRTLGSRQQLLETDPEDLRRIVQQEALAAIRQCFPSEARPASRLQTLEAERILALVLEWLQDVDSRRAPFEVLETEKRAEARLGSLTLAYRADRIDRLEDGSQLIIDYKTGRNLSNRDFFTTPLREPQLPLYALNANPAAVSAIAFGRLRKGDCALLGAASEPSISGPGGRWEVPGTGQCETWADWKELLTFWRQQLETLAADFINGEAAVRPFDRSLSCRTCDLAGLCRIGTADLRVGGTDVH